MVGLRMFYDNHHLFQKTSFQSIKAEPEAKKKVMRVPMARRGLASKVKKPNF
ncbi:hypothetical protein Hdeb2414_s0009g00320491 [Helianthus debilis subsp. tardiflorus]